MAFFQVAQNGTHPEKDAGHLVGGQGCSKRQAQKYQNRKLDQANTTTGERGKEVSDDCSDKKDGLSGQVERHGVCLV